MKRAIHNLYILLAILCSPAYSVTLLDEDFETGQTVGEQPLGATRVRPNTNTSEIFVKVVSGTENTADGGVGNGVQLFDFSADPAALEYDIVGSGDEGISRFRFSLDFAYVSGSGPDHIFLSGGARGDALTSSSRRWFSAYFEANGSVEGVDVSDGLQHHMDLFVNDSDAAPMIYVGPEGGATLQTNSVAFYVDGEFINEELLSAAVFGSSNNFGRIGFNTYSAASNVSYTFDNLNLFEIEDVIDSDSSWLVYAGTNGLVYAGYANEGQSNAVNTVPDFSRAGYRGGGVSIPFVPAGITVTNGPGDDTELIQAAIDSVSALPVGTNGFRGAVLLVAGDYTVSSTLVVAASGVVVRGVGSQEVGGTRITYTAATQSNLFEVDNGGDQPREVSGTRQRIADAYVPVGAKQFFVADASGFAAGDSIIIQNTMNQQWMDDLSDMGQWGWTPSAYQLTFRRVITAVEGNRVTVDAPVVQAIETRYGGGAVYTYTFAGELENIGFEGLRLESAYVGESDEQHGWNAIEANRLKNGWVRQVTGRYFGYGLVNLISNCRQITVEDCAMLDPKSITTGGRKYSFNIDDSDYILMQRCLTRGGRHDFASGSKTPGPNVFVDCRANETYADIGPHHRYATGQLYDNIMGGEINVQNRTDSGTGHGWAGAQIMFWNCDSTSMICDAPTGAMNWCVGSIGLKSEGTSSWAPEEPFGIWDSHNSPVIPRSLYYAQLSDRLGGHALNNVRLPDQSAGGIWTQLDSWGGDGLFLDGLVVWVDTENISEPYSPVAVRGVVRDLQTLENGYSCSWSKESGPGTVSFSDSAALEAMVSFSQPGEYVLRLSVDDGIAQQSADLTVEVWPSPDSDVDDLADSWERVYFGNLTVSDGQPFQDFDGDGFNDLHEYLAGTNPTNGSSLLKFTQAELAAGTGQLVLEWQAVADRDYRVLETTHLVESGWVTNASHIPGTEPSCVHTVMLENAEAYFRVELEE